MNTVDETYEWVAAEAIRLVNRGISKQKMANWLRMRVAYLAAVEEAERMYATGEAQNYAECEICGSADTCESCRIAVGNELKYGTSMPWEKQV